MAEYYRGYRITSPYGMRSDPFTKDQVMHTGIDLVIADKAPIKAFTAGEVVYNKEGATGSGFGGFGNVVAIKDYLGAVQFYAHLDSIKVTLGQMLKAGDVLGTQGNTGHSKGSHLHYEVREVGRNPSFGFGSHTNPTTYLEKYFKEVKPVEKPTEKATEQWKLDIMAKAKAKGLITGDHNPDDAAPKWFVLQTIMNALDK